MIQAEKGNFLVRQKNLILKYTMAKFNDMLFLFFSIVGFLTVLYYLYYLVVGDVEDDEGFKSKGGTRAPALPWWLRRR